MKPKVTIIIPNFNRVNLLKESLLSVESQTFTDWECIIIDDGSTDNSINLIESFTEKDNRFRLIIRDKKPKGASTCRNLGILHSKSEYIVFLDSDDLLSSTCLQSRLSFMEGNKSLDIGVFPALGFKEKPGDYNLLWNILNKQETPSHLHRFLRGDTPWATLSCIWRKSFLEKIGGWDQEASCWQDWELHIRALLENAQYSCCDTKPDSFFRCDHEYFSIGKNENREKHLLSRRQTINALWEKYYDKLKQNNNNIYIMLWSFRIAVLLREIGEEDEAKKTWYQGKKWDKSLVIRYMLWSFYMKKRYYKAENKNKLIKKVLDKLFYRVYKPHFWDTQTTFKKIILD